MTGSDLRRVADILDEASELAERLGQKWLSWLIQREVERLEIREMRVLLVGPASSGKTSTVLALLGEASAKSLDGTDMLPVGVRPTTAHLIHVYTGFEFFEAELRWEDGRLLKTSDPALLRKLLAQQDAQLRRAIVNVPESNQIPAGVVMTDSPGVGADNSEFADALVEEALGLADIILFHVRVPRGLGPSVKILEKVRDLYPYRNELSKRFLPVLTDVRTPGRIQEILEGLTSSLGFEVSRHAAIARRGDVEALSSILHEFWEDPDFVTPPARGAELALRNVIIPELEMAVRSRERLLEGRELTRQYLEKWIKDGETYATLLRQKSAEARAKALRELKSVVENTGNQAKMELENVIGQMANFLWETYQDECVRTLQTRLLDDFEHRAEKILSDILAELARDCGEAVEAFDQNIRLDELRISAPNFQELKIAATEITGGQAARRFLGSVNRMGGRGGVKQGTINLERKVVAKLYRLAGFKAAPADLIRSGIPRAIGPLGDTLKFLSRRAWIVAVAREVIGTGWQIMRAPGKLRKLTDHIIQQWREGPELTLWQRINSTPRPPGVLECVEIMVRDTWEGTRIEKDAVPGLDRWPGVNQQIESAVEAINEFIEEKRSELRDISEGAAVVRSLRNRLTLLKERVEQQKEAHDEH